jgi:hypothetical protein
VAVAGSAVFTGYVSYLAVYKAVARRMRALREGEHPGADEMAEVIYVNQTLQTPAVALLTPHDLQLIGIAGQPLKIARDDRFASNRY